MKIILASAFVEGSTGFSIYNKLTEFGHHVIPFDYRLLKFKGEPVEQHLYDLQKDCDLLFSVKGDFKFNPDKLHIPSVLWFLDETKRYNWFEEVSKQYTKVFTSDPDAPKDTHYLPPGVDMTVHHSVEPDSKYYCELGFAGTCRPERTTIMQLLYDRKVSLKVYGNSWNPSAPYYCGNAIYNEKLNKFISSSKYTLNLVRGNGLNSRVLECLVNGNSILLSQKTKGISDMFEPGMHLFFWEDIEELMELIDNDLTESGRREILRMGKEEVLEKHTLELRLSNILDEVT